VNNFSFKVWVGLGSGELSAFNVSALSITAVNAMVGHTAGVNAIARINQNQVATVGSNMQTIIWDMNTSAMVNKYYYHTCRGLNVVLLPSGMLATGGCDGTVRILNFQTNTVSKLPNTGGSWFYGLKINWFVGPNGALVTGSNVNGRPSDLANLAFYDAMNLTRLQQTTTNFYIYDIEIVSPNGYVAVGGFSYLNVYSKTAGLVSSMNISGTTIVKLKILPDNVTLVCGTKNVSILLFNVNTNTLGPTYTGGSGYIPWGYPINILEVTPDQLFLVSSAGLQFWFWKWTTMSLTLVNMFTANGFTGRIQSGAFMTTTYNAGNC
jgi:WD40 repeat protein